MNKLLFVTLLSFVIAATSFIFAAADSHQEQEQAHKNNNVHHWVLFHINEDGTTSVIGAKPISDETPTSPCLEDFPSTTHGKNKAHNKRLIVVSYQKNDGKQCHVAVKDPRLLWHDQEHPTKGPKHFHGHVKKQDSSNFAIVISTDIDRLETVDLSSKSHDRARRHHKIEQHHFRAAETLASDIDANLIDVSTLQLVGTTTNQRNMVILSSGYTAAEKSKFDADVKRAVDFIQQSSNDVSSMPYFRYFSTWNIFSVWHPSVESGASKPAPAGPGLTTNNILQCTYGSTSGRILSCNRPRVLVMSSYAPPDPSTSLTIILVNDVVFGGTGGGGICAVYTGDRMNVVFIHEIGHAFADLSDEYSYDTSEAEQLELINCHWDPVVDVPWRDWVDASVLGTPEPICTYLNYYKPTPGQCLMERDTFDLCEVCKEATVRTMYGQIGTSAPAGMNLAAPRFPSEHDTIVIRNTADNSTLWMNTRINTIRDSSGDFSTKWIYNGTTIAENVSSLTIASATGSGAVAEWVHPGVGDYTITLQITDHTNMLLPNKLALEYVNTSSKQAMRQDHTFKIKIVADTETCATQGGTVRNNTHGGQYCGVCQAGFEAECALNVTARPLAAVADVSGQIPELEGWLIGLGIGFVVLGAIAFFFTFKTMQQHAEENVGEILPLSETLVILRYVLLVCQAVLLLVSTFVIMYAAYMFIVLSIFGRPMILGICITACFVWFFSFIGFTGAYFNNRQVVFSSFILSIFFLAMTLIFTGMLLHTQMNVGSDADVFLQLRSEWQTTVSTDPEAACKMQSYLYCSGFENSCVTANTATSDCPKKCDLANQIAFPCWPKVQEFVDKHFYNAAIGGIVLAVFLLIIMVVSVIFGCGMKINRARITKQRYKRAQEGRNTLSDGELGMLRNEFRKVDKKKTGQITRDQFAKFYSKTMGVSMNKDQLQEYFDALDTDGSGTLSFEEFVKIYMPAVDVTTDMLEQEKKKEEARLEERKKLLGLVDSEGRPSDTISPAAANIDPLAVAAVRDEIENEKARRRQQESQQQSRFGGGAALVSAVDQQSSASATAMKDIQGNYKNLDINNNQSQEMTPIAQTRQHQQLQQQLQQQFSDEEEPSEEQVILVDDDDDDDIDDVEEDQQAQQPWTDKMSESARLRDLIREKSNLENHE